MRRATFMIAVLCCAAWAGDDKGTATAPAPQDDGHKAIEALGYLPGTNPVPAATGVLTWVKDAALTGFTLYVSGHEPGATLIDMEGKVVHHWRRDFRAAFPGFQPKAEPLNYWRRVHLFPNGDLLAIFEGTGFFKLDKDSHLLWSQVNGAHHDLDIAPNGDIYLLTNKVRVIPRVSPQQPVCEDYITILDPDGHPKSSVSILECFENSAYKWFADGNILWQRLYGRLSQSLRGETDLIELFHTNTIQILDGKAADLNPVFQAGNLLVCMAAVSCIAVIDYTAQKVVWLNKGNYSYQHEALQIDNRHLLLFDNLGLVTRSRVMEFDLAAMTPVWVYGGAKGEDFSSLNCGMARRLSNGNTLIVSSREGRIFEVTRDKQRVWEFVSPHHVGDESGDEYVGSIFQAERVTPEYVQSWLASNDEGTGKREGKQP